MINYLITVFILHVCALFIYELLLKNTTFLNGNRSYLLLVPVVLWLIPFINIAALNPEPVVEEMVFQTSFVQEEVTESQVVVETPTIPIQMETREETSFNFSWWWIYFLGFGISLIWFVKNFYQLRKHKGQAVVQELNGIKYHKISDSKIALSFMGSILIGDQIKSEYLESIVAHEQVHIKQKHHFDLMFFQFLGIIMWCNPFHYIFLNRLKLTHELLADRAVAQQVGTKNYAQLLLKETFDTSNVAFANMFFSFKTIKTRITMLHKKSSPQIAKMRYASLFVLLLTAVIYTSCTTAKKKELTLEQQISNLQETLKKTDSISFKDMEALEKLTISGYSFEEGAEYAKILGEEDERRQQEFEKSPEGIALKAKYDSINSITQYADSIYLGLRKNEISRKEYEQFVQWVNDSVKSNLIEDEVNRRFSEKMRSMVPKKQQPIIYYTDKDGGEVRNGFELPRTENCLSKSSNEVKECIIEELSSFFAEKINKHLDDKYTSYENSLNMNISNSGKIENINFYASTVSFEEFDHNLDNKKFREILNKIKKDLPTSIPATMDGEPIEVTIILPIKVR